jgi:hypothetical protein
MVSGGGVIGAFLRLLDAAKISRQAENCEAVSRKAKPVETCLTFNSLRTTVLAAKGHRKLELNTGTNVMIFKNTYVWKKSAILTQATAIKAAKVYHNIGFQEKRQFFPWKIAENSDHNIVPSCQIGSVHFLKLEILAKAEN